MACDVTTLEASACSNGFAKIAQNEALYRAIELQLLCEISEGGGTGGGGEAGAGSPEGVVTANPGTTYVDTSDESFWVKLTGTGNTGWIQLIA